MKAVLQLVTKAQVLCEGEITGRIDDGLLVLLGVAAGDTEKEAALLASKIANLRIFKDEDGKMNRSLLDIDGKALCVSNFTLCADASHGRRPAYTDAARPEMAEPLYRRFCDELLACGVCGVEKGVFGGHMTVSLDNEGPITLVLDTDIWKKG